MPSNLRRTVCNAGRLRATSAHGLLSSRSAVDHGRSLGGRAAYSVPLPRALPGRRVTEHNLGDIGDGTSSRINARRQGYLVTHISQY